MTDNQTLITLIILAVALACAVWVHAKMKGDPHTKAAADQLAKARLDALKHRAAAEECRINAEWHTASANMLDERIRRLQPGAVLDVAPYFADTQFGGL